MATETASRYCPKCKESCDSDFCPSCRSYLAWELSTDTEPSPIEEAQTAVIDAPTAVRLQVQVAGLDIEDPEALGALRLAAGSALTLTARVRNETGIVDEFLLDVQDLPAEWVEVHPPTLHLAPAGSREQVAGDVTIVIAPPRSASTRPGRWTFAVRVSAGSPATERARATTALTVEPFAALEIDAQPKIAAGRRRASFACELGNLGNADAIVTLLASDAAQGCWFDLPSQSRLAPGARIRQVVSVRPVRMLWVGRPVDHRVQIQASTPTTGLGARAPALIYRQRPWVPWWAPPLILLLLVLAAALYLALPREVTMPALIGAPSAFAAQQELSQAGLRSTSQIATEIVSKVAPGTVVGQAPAAGKRIPASTPVILQVAAAPATTTIVPSLVGLTPAQAEADLARIHLKLGAVSPQLEPKAHVASQLPTPGSLRSQETSVEIVLAPRTVRVPGLRGRRLPAAERALGRVGLSLGGVTPKPLPGARVLTQIPTSGAQTRVGSKVEVVVVQRAVVVPRLRGMTVQGADTALGICGLRLGPLPPTIRAGQLVAAQVPGSGSHREAGTAVTVILQAKPRQGAHGTKAPALPTPRQCSTSL
jgi:beta-lactam-binding protein with PASTA domain